MTTNKTRKVEFVSNTKVSKLTRQLAHQIQDDGYHPDIIVAIARGGYIPARLLCDHLDINNLASFRVTHYTGAQKAEQTRLSLPLTIDVRGMNVLLVDDITDTGDTLRLALDHIHAFQPQQLRVAVLHHKTVSTVVPDYYARKIVRWRWITYPWAVIEDTLGFVKQLQPRPATIEQAMDAVAKAHGVKISRPAMEDVFRLL